MDSLLNVSPDASVAVVDNEGSDEIAAIVGTTRRRGLMVDYINPGANLGYAGGVALGFRLVGDADVILVLNPDVELLVDPRHLVPLLDKADIVAGTLASVDDPQPKRIANARPPVTLWREALRSAFGSRVYRGPRRAVGRAAQRVAQLDGAYLLMRTAWCRNHPMDLRFELYYEDVALCDEARRESGCMVANEVVAIHVGGVSTAGAGAAAYLVHRVSRARYLRIRHPRLPSFLLGALFRLEAASRSITSQPEQGHVRRNAVRLALAELRHPESVRVLRRMNAQTAQ
jgi:GT2 family glycosyltransferase